MPPAKRKVVKVQLSTSVAVTAGVSEAAANSALSHKNRGNELFSLQNFEGAAMEYTTAIELSPSEDVEGLTKLYSNRSACYACRSCFQNLEKALSDAEMCIQLDDSWAKGYYRKGAALMEMKRLDESRICCELGLTKQADNSDIHQLMKDVGRKRLEADIREDMEEDSPDKDKFDELVEWLRAGNSEFPKLYLKRYAENYRGVHCFDQINGEDAVMRIPRKFLITVEMGKNCDVGQSMILNNLDLSASKHCFLCVYVLVDRDDPSSFFQPYYRILPSSFSNMPLFWSEEDLSWLAGSYILEQISERKINIKQDYEDICRVAPEFSRYSLADFTWARLMVASRNFGIDMGDVKTDALVPYADMLNHKRPRQTKWQYENKTESFVITALEDIAIGSQVYDSYGKKCNSRFLLNYGFSIESNRDADGKCHNEVHVNLSLLTAQISAFQSDQHVNMIRSLLVAHGSTRSGRMSNAYADKNTREIFTFARLYSCTPSELMSLPALDVNYDFDKNPIGPISTENEIKVLNYLMETCEAMLAMYPSHLNRVQLDEYDDGLGEESNLMKHFPPFSNIWNSLVLIRGEKEICHHYIRLAMEATPILSMHYRDAKAIIKQQYAMQTFSDSCEIEIAKYMTIVVPLLLKRKLISNDDDGN